MSSRKHPTVCNVFIIHCYWLINQDSAPVLPQQISLPLLYKHRHGATPVSSSPRTGFTVWQSLLVGDSRASRHGTICRGVCGEKCRNSSNGVWDSRLTQRLPPQSAFNANRCRRQSRRHLGGVDALPSPTSTFPSCSFVHTGRPDDYSQPPVSPLMTPPEFMSVLHCRGWKRVQRWELFFWTLLEPSSIMEGCSALWNLPLIIKNDFIYCLFCYYIYRWPWTVQPSLKGVK